jgi:nucleoside-diphosphate-sugar epimerase
VSNNASSDDSVTQVDFSDPLAIRRAVTEYGKPDVFLHLGWGEVYQPQSDVHETANVSDTRNLIDELYRGGLEKFIFLGSASEYGDRTGVLSEDMDGHGKLTAYVKGKKAASEYGFEAAEKLGRVFVHIRLFHTYGAGQHQNSLINQLYRSSVGGLELSLTPCEHYRDYVYVSDVTEGIRLMTQVDASTTVNLGSGQVVMLREFVELFWERLGGDPALLKFGAHARPENEPTQPQCFADLTRLERLTTWKPTIELADGIELTIDMLRSGGIG